MEDGWFFYTGVILKDVSNHGLLLYGALGRGQLSLVFLFTTAPGFFLSCVSVV
jgi:hypothetical protein